MLPIEGVEIQQIEGNFSIKTDSEGLAILSDSDLEIPPISAISDSTAYAFSFVHEDYRPRELNAGKGELIVYLTSDSSRNYTYSTPVQLDDGFTTGNLSDAGFDTSRTNRLLSRTLTNGYRELHSLLIYKDDKLVLEEYYFGNNDTIQFENNIYRDRTPAPIQWTRKQEHYVASVNKALTSKVTGIALDAHGVSSSATIKEYLPEYSSYFENNSNKAALTFNHALNMRLGFQWNEWGGSDLSLMWKSDDFADYLLSKNNNGPGSSWVYNSAAPNVILKALENMVNEPIRDWAATNFYERLGITDYEWQSQPDGYPEGAARMYMRPRDLLKIGVLYLNNGRWNGDQVVQPAWVDKVFEEGINTSSGIYSHGFWLRELKGNAYLSGDGDGGNFINIFPEQNMVIVITQDNYLEWPLYVNQAEDMMGNYILPALE